MNNRHLEVFYAVMTCGSISRAAEMLHVSQPAVSKTLSHAEIQLGFLLFERNRGKLIPTKEGLILFKKVQKIYEDLNDLKKLAVNLSSKPQLNLVIGCLPSLGLSIIPDVTKIFLDKYPESKIDINTYHTNELVRLLHSHELDFAISFHPMKEVGISTIKITEIPLVYLDDKPLAQKYVTLDDIDESRWINPGSASLSKMIQKNRVLQVSQLNAHTYSMAAKFVKRGMGCTVSDVFSAIEVLSYEMIHPLSPSINLDLCLLYNTDRPLTKSIKDYELILKIFLSNKLDEINQKLYLSE